MKVPVTVLVAAKNEACNIQRCLAALGPAERVIVIDSHSTDGTPDLAREARAEVVQFCHTGGYPKKRQWALDTVDVRTPWILLLDADEVVPLSLWNEIAAAIAAPTIADAFFVTKGYHFLGRRFRFGGFSFAAVLLLRRGRARFERLVDDDSSGLDMEIHERVIVDGRIDRLKTPLVHEDFKGLAAYLERHNQYSSWEARVRYAYRLTGRWGAESVQPRLLGNTQERRRFLKDLALRIPFEPLLWFGYHYLFKLGFLEGRRGLIATQIRCAYLRQVRAKMYELDLARQ